MTKPTNRSRREFLAQSAVAGVVATGSLAIARSAHAAGSDLVKIALIGAGGRGTGAAVNALNNTGHANVKLVAVADAFQSRLDGSLKAIEKACPGKVDVPAERRFVGLDAFQKAIATDANMVLLCSPPGFRPAQFEASVAAGKHVFMEKPVATDAPGYRKVKAANQQAKSKGLAVAVGHHLRHAAGYREIVGRIHNGALGNVTLLRGYFNTSGIWNRPRQDGQTEMQYQVQNWYHFVWLSGDHNVEQHVHDIDICNWVAKGHPVEANGMGGRSVRVSKGIGEIFDNHFVEYTYADGLKFYSQCRQIPNCWNSFSQEVHGAQGTATMHGDGKTTLSLTGQKPEQWRSPVEGHQAEMNDLFAALAASQAYNEADWAADSTMTAILGRMATYSGQIVRWDAAVASSLDLAPAGLTWETEPKTKPLADGSYACAVPGVTKAL